MAILYRIRNWRELYETNDSRKWARLPWIKSPCDLQSTGLSIIRAHDEAAGIIGVWELIRQYVASRPAPRDGSLGRPSAPFCHRAIAAVIGLPERIVSIAMPILVSVGWVEALEAGEDRAETGPRPGHARAATGRKVRSTLTSTSPPLREGESAREATRGDGGSAPVPPTPSLLRSGPEPDTGAPPGGAEAERAPVQRGALGPPEPPDRAFVIGAWLAAADRAKRKRSAMPNRVADELLALGHDREAIANAFRGAWSGKKPKAANHVPNDFTDLCETGAKLAVAERSQAVAAAEAKRRADEDAAATAEAAELTPAEKAAQLRRNADLLRKLGRTEGAADLEREADQLDPPGPAPPGAGAA